ncbi:hypothetical protein [Pseudomonas indica]|uniref:hypothetical protein n=1 Tax=Pseudomonas indica TaxID=137658 RepID=UPI0023F90F4D|nr:hypothetical protein [Pseudomonas indica]MBU3059264.1 hypothetical protein [Pseudomonas indica]
MFCTQQGCGKSWNAGEQFPLCITNPCPLRQYRDSQVQAPRFNAKTQIDVKFGEKSAGVVASIDKIRSDITQPLQPYAMQGEEKATTTVTLPSGLTERYSTDTNMHSEMRALQAMLQRGYWVLRYGRVFLANGQAVPATHFVTDQPHCGFCTIVLAALGLPLTSPTSGNHKYGCNAIYPLPLQLRRDVMFIIRLINRGSMEYTALKRLLNVFVNAPAASWLLQINDFLLVSDTVSCTFDNLPKGFDPREHRILHLNDFLDNEEKLNLLWKFILMKFYESNKSTK